MEASAAAGAIAARERLPGAVTERLRGAGESARAADWPRTTRALPWALVGFVVMIWIVPFDSMRLPVGLPVDATLDRPMLVGLVALWLAATTPRRRATTIHWALAAFGLVAVLSLMAHAETLGRLGELEVPIKKLALLASYGAFFAVAASAIRPSEAPKMAKLLIALASVTAIGVLVENRFGLNPFHDWIGPLFPGYSRPEGIGTLDSIGRKAVVGPAALPLSVAVMLTIALPFAVVGMAEARGRRRFLYGLAAGLLLAGALATSKKTGLVGPVVCVLVLLAYRPRQVLRLAPFGILVIAMVHVAAPGSLSGVVEQFSPSSFRRVNTTQDRVGDYQAVSPDLAAHPLLGRGYESYDQKRHRILDNQYLSLAIGVGLVGVLAYLAVIASGFLTAHQLSRSRDPDRAALGIAAAAAIAAAAVISALLDFLSLPQLPYLFCFAVALVVAASRGEEGSESA